MLRRPTVELESQPVVGVPQNLWWYSPECLATFPGMFEDIPRNIWRYSSEYLRTFRGMFGDIPRNTWRHSPEYNIPPIPRFPLIPFPVTVFLIIYIAVFYQQSFNVTDFFMKQIPLITSFIGVIIVIRTEICPFSFPSFPSYDYGVIWFKFCSGQFCMKIDVVRVWNICFVVKSLIYFLFPRTSPNLFW